MATNQAKRRWKRGKRNRKKAQNRQRQISLQIQKERVKHIMRRHIILSLAIIGLALGAQYAGNPIKGTTVYADPGACPSNGQMQALHGFDKTGVKPIFIEGVSWEQCLFGWQAVGVGSTDLPMLKGWQYTVTRAADDVVAVYYGDGSTIRVKGFSARFVLAYPRDHLVWDGCRLLESERAYGLRRDPPYQTISGNVCSGGVSTPVDPPGTNVANPVSPTANTGSNVTVIENRERDPQWMRCPDPGDRQLVAYQLMGDASLETWVTQLEPNRLKGAYLITVPTDTLVVVFAPEGVEVDFNIGQGDVALIGPGFSPPVPSSTAKYRGCFPNDVY